MHLTRKFEAIGINTSQRKKKKHLNKGCSQFLKSKKHKKYVVFSKQECINIAKTLYIV